MKVLFLDIDGVLNSAEWFLSGVPKNIWDLDPKAVRRLKRILEATGAKVVLSSAWRKYPKEVAHLRTLFDIHDMTPVMTTFLGCTHRRPDGGPQHGADNCTDPLTHPVPRHEEISAWLAAHPEVTAFAIVDDDPDAGRIHPDRYVRTYWRHGMYGKHERALTELLS